MRKVATVLVMALAVSALFMIPAVEAGNCGYGGYTYSQNYSYQQPYQYQSYNYTPVQYKYVDREVLYPYPVKAIVAPDFYFTSQDHYQKQQQAQQNSLVADAAAYRALAIMANLQGGNRVQPGANIPAPYDPRTAPVPQQPLQQPRQGVQGAMADPSIPAGLQAVVEQRCLKCHGSQDPKRLDLSNLAAVPKLSRYESWEMVNAGTMPKSAPALADAEERLFRQWATSAKR